MSPRPRKPRRCACPLREGGASVFKPVGVPAREVGVEVLEHDELEALHLCDGLGLTQEEAGERMGVSRGTVQRLLAGARRKVATALVEGKALRLETRKHQEPRRPP